MSMRKDFSYGKPAQEKKINYQWWHHRGVESTVKAKVLCLWKNGQEMLARVQREDKKFIIRAAKGLKKEAEVTAYFGSVGENTQLQPGDAAPLRIIPDNTSISDVEDAPGDGSKWACTSPATVIRHEGNEVVIQFASGKTKSLADNCMANIGPFIQYSKSNSYPIRPAASQDHHPQKRRRPQLSERRL